MTWDKDLPQRHRRRRDEKKKREGGAMPLYPFVSVSLCLCGKRQRIRVMANGILVFIEHVDGKINRASYEAVRAAQLIGAQTGQEVSAVIFGQGVGEIAAEVATKKVKTVY